MKVATLVLLLCVIGCSNRGVYEGLQTGARNECSKLPSSQYDECMEATETSFDEYERERREVIEK